MAAEVEERNISQVKSFIEEKKRKKEPSKKDADEFERLWLAAVEEDGLDKETFSLSCVTGSGMPPPDRCLNISR